MKLLQSSCNGTLRRRGRGGDPSAFNMLIIFYDHRMMNKVAYTFTAGAVRHSLLLILIQPLIPVASELRIKNLRTNFSSILIAKKKVKTRNFNTQYDVKPDVRLKIQDMKMTAKKIMGRGRVGSAGQENCGQNCVA